MPKKKRGSVLRVKNVSYFLMPEKLPRLQGPLRGMPAINPFPQGALYFTMKKKPGTVRKNKENRSFLT